MTGPSLAKRRLLVVGASRGIGRALVDQAVAAGARVAAVARRPITGLPEGAVAISADVRDPDDCAALARRAVEAIGGLDSLVYAAGVSPLAEIADADVEVWRAVLETNVVGAALVVRGALPHLLEPGGHAAFLTSTMVGRPWPALAPYAASRAAMVEMVRGLRREHPALRTTTVVVGPTKTGFAEQWDPAVVPEMMQRWRDEGYLVPGGESLRAEEVAGGLVSLFASPVRIDHLDLVPAVRAPGWVDR